MGMAKSKLEKQIIEHTKKSKTYVAGVTDKLISDLLLNISIQNGAEADLKERGLIINISKTADPYYTVNPSKNVVHECIKTTQSICRQLAISPDAILKNSDDKDSSTDAFEKLQEKLFSK